MSRLGYPRWISRLGRARGVALVAADDLHDSSSGRERNIVSDWLFAHEPAVRGALAATIFALLAASEALFPRRPRAIGRRRRWPANLGVAAISSGLVRLVFPAAAVGIAFAVEAHGWGLLNVVHLPDWLSVVAAVVVLDLALYAQHVAFHKVPVLWRLHRMHHADLELDVTTGLRFHPVEVLLSMVIKGGVIALSGASPLAVLIFEALLNATSMFNHANLALPSAVDRLTRLLLVTPDMHRVHHSIRREETDSNFGFNVPWWDRLFATYRAQPTDGHAGMTIGIPQFRDPVELRIDRMLMQPLRSG
jgi:sterol desaturase/sphingolipid hydroxylase (fatty acid hydroxylase superfamily)